MEYYYKHLVKRRKQGQQYPLAYTIYLWKTPQSRREKADDVIYLNYSLFINKNVDGFGRKCNRNCAAECALEVRRRHNRQTYEFNQYKSILVLQSMIKLIYVRIHLWIKQCISEYKQNYTIRFSIQKRSNDSINELFKYI